MTVLSAICPAKLSCVVICGFDGTLDLDTGADKAVGGENAQQKGRRLFTANSGASGRDFIVIIRRCVDGASL